MGYMHIENLYKNQTILMFKECYALEKVHGTSAHVAFKDGRLTFFSGGASHSAFAALFREQELLAAFVALGHAEVTVYGEACGGSMQKMRATYGDALSFVVFDVKVGDTWLDVPDAADVAGKLGLEFVDYARTTTDLPALDALRDAPSSLAIKRGLGGDKHREGVVLRPLREMFDKRGDRVIAKHKRAEFGETKTPRTVDEKQAAVMEKAEAIAQEWVTDMRLTHVLDKLGNPTEMSRTGDVINAMIEDVMREAKGEILDSKEARRLIGQMAAKKYKALITRVEA